MKEVDRNRCCNCLISLNAEKVTRNGSITFDVKFTRGQIVTKAALVLGVVIQLGVVDHQSMNGSVAHHLVLLSVRFDLFSVLLPRRRDVVFGHGALEGDVLAGQCLGVLQSRDELERQSWTQTERK